MQTSLGVIGGGVLGRAIFRGFVEHADVRVYDRVRERATHTLAEAATADIVMIALPTPAREDGTCDTSAIDKFLHEAQLEEYWRPHSCYVVRSTVPIGYTQEQARKRDFFLPLLHSPEFLTARCSLTDFQTPARNIIGQPMLNEDRSAFGVAGETLLRLYERRFPGVPVHIMPSNASELVKLACNTFFASKVTLFNLFAEIAAAAGVSWDDVRGGILSDGRIAHAHTEVRDGGGFSGSCLPKDMLDLFHCATAMGCDASVLAAVHESNKRRRPGDPHIPAGEISR